MLRTTVGQLLINDALPADMADFNRVLDKKGVAALFNQIAEQHPEKYSEIAHSISNIGHQAATETGGHSFGVRSIRTPASTRLAIQSLERTLRKIHTNPDLSDDEKEHEVLRTTLAAQKQLQSTVFDAAKADGNPLAQQVVSGARGNPVNLNSLLGADLLYVDHRDRAIPMPVLRNYAQGLTPAQYFAGAFGARKGIVDLKQKTADAGFLGKQLSQVSHRLVVSGVDDDEEHDDSTPRGLPVDTDDPGNEGALLAHPIGDLPRNTQLTPRMLKAIKAAGHDTILVRSPLVGGPRDGGVYSRDVGVREKGRLAPIGDYVGIAAAQALAAPITQSQISSKHSGGVAGASAKAISGFGAINALVQIPKIFPGGAAHAQLDGRVDNVRDAPQGGKYVTVSGQDHYVGADFPPSVKVGDNVEAGDTISEGMPHPGEIVKYKGIGEGRRYFMQAFHKTLQNSGINAHRRNVELLGRGLINHVRLTDELGDWSPDDVIPYQALERTWEPRPGTQVAPPRDMPGRYLERPVLHYSIGTQLRPSVISNLEKYGVTQVHAHHEAPPFQPEMIRGMANVAHDPDWMAKLLGSYQKDSLLEATRRGGVSDSSGTSYVPALAEGTNFGLSGATKGWKP